MVNERLKVKLRRKSALATASLIALGSISGCGSQETDDPRAEDVTSSAPDPAESKTPDPTETASPLPSKTATTPAVQSCKALLANGWMPPQGQDPDDLSWSPTTGVMEITFTDNASLTVNILEDKACQRLPVVGPLIKRALENQAQ